MRIWAKIRPDGSYHSPNFSHAVYGFRELGAEILKYEKVKDIYDYVDKEDIVLDYINQCLTIFSKFGKQPRLDDYPDCLGLYLGRTVWRDTINHVNGHPELWNIFVKPVKQKAFTGRVVKSPADFIGCGSCYEDYEVWCSDIVNIKREWRGFVLYDKLIDIRPYAGDYHYTFDPDVIDKVMDAFIGWEDRPAACSLDFAVIERNGKQETIFLEANDAFALGNYGLHHIDYAKMISARWSQILDRKDEFFFN